MRSFTEAVKNRRSIYALGKNIPVLETEIMAAIERMTKDVPSPFNMQSARVVVAMKEHHENIWEITESALRKIVPEDKFEPTKKKLDGFAAGSSISPKTISATNFQPSGTLKHFLISSSISGL